MGTTEKVDIANVLIDNVTMIEAIERIEQLILGDNHSYVVTPNVDHIVKIQNDKQLRTIYQDAALVLADGMPLIGASKLLNTPLKEKVSGSDLFPRLCEFAAQKGYSLYFLGGRDDAASRCATVLRDRFKKLSIKGIYSPPFGFENDRDESDKIVKNIQQTKPDILFVGLGFPKQEKWIHANRKRLCVPVSVGIGVSFEFVAGVVRRAPMWMQRSGLEWVWRLAMEPKRLWKRYLIDDVPFLWLILKQKFGR